MSVVEQPISSEKIHSKEQKSFIQKSDEVIDSLRRNKNLFELKKSGLSTKDAIETTALDIAASEGLGYTDSEKNILGVIGHLGSFVIGQKRASEISVQRENSYLNQEVRKELRELKVNTLIPFNHAIKELINTDSSLSKDVLDANLTRLYMRLFSSDDPLVVKATERGSLDQSVLGVVSRDALQQISVATNGMRHEIAAETILTAAGYSYDYNVNTNEDAQGADLFVYLESGWTHIDIKASEASANKALLSHRNSHAVWTGLNPSKFDGAKGDQSNALRVSFDTALESADGFIQRIYDVSQR